MYVLCTYVQYLLYLSELSLSPSAASTCVSVPYIHRWIYPVLCALAPAQRSRDCIGTTCNCARYSSRGSRAATYLRGCPAAAPISWFAMGEERLWFFFLEELAGQQHGPHPISPVVCAKTKRLLVAYITSLFQPGLGFV